MAKRVFSIDGDAFDDLDGLYDEVSRKLIPGTWWGRNLDGLDDVLDGGFGTPEEGFVLIWKNSERSRQRLGYDETVKHLKLMLKHCHPSNREEVGRRLAAAERREGETVFDWLVDIIRDHRDTALVLE